MQPRLSLVIERHAAGTPGDAEPIRQIVVHFILNERSKPAPNRDALGELLQLLPADMFSQRWLADQHNLQHRVERYRRRRAGDYYRLERHVDHGDSCL